jgi:hypothetical protein
VLYIAWRPIDRQRGGQETSFVTVLRIPAVTRQIKIFQAGVACDDIRNKTATVAGRIFTGLSLYFLKGPG